MAVLGLDIGGSGIKGAPVDTQTGELIQPRLRRPTPVMGKPDEVADVIAGMVEHFQWQGNIGCGFPGVVQHGVGITAANVSEDWVGTDIAALLTLRTGCPTTVLNDADAAGMAEMKFGAGREYQKGVVLMITIGTGIGSTIFVNGNLLPNLEFGHMQVRGKDAEHRASDAVRTAKNLSWKKWAKRVNEFLMIMEGLFYPDLIIVGGGASKEHERFFPYLTLQTKIVPAELLNNAGIVGAALAADDEG